MGELPRDMLEERESSLFSSPRLEREASSSRNCYSLSLPSLSDLPQTGSARRASRATGDACEAGDFATPRVNTPLCLPSAAPDACSPRSSSFLRSSLSSFSSPSSLSSLSCRDTREAVALAGRKARAAILAARRARAEILLRSTHPSTAASSSLPPSTSSSTAASSASSTAASSASPSSSSSSASSEEESKGEIKGENEVASTPAREGVLGTSLANALLPQSVERRKSQRGLECEREGRQCAGGEKRGEGREGAAATERKERERESQTTSTETRDGGCFRRAPGGGNLDQAAEIKDYARPNESEEGGRETTDRDDERDKRGSNETCRALHATVVSRVGDAVSYPAFAACPSATLSENATGGYPSFSTSLPPNPSSDLPTKSPFNQAHSALCARQNGSCSGVSWGLSRRSALPPELHGLCRTLFVDRHLGHLLEEERRRGSRPSSFASVGTEKEEPCRQPSDAADCARDAAPLRCSCGVRLERLAETLETDRRFGPQRGRGGALSEDETEKAWEEEKKSDEDARTEQLRVPEEHLRYAFDFILALWEIHKRMVEHGSRRMLDSPLYEEERPEENASEQSPASEKQSQQSRRRRFVAVKADAAAPFPSDSAAADRLILEVKEALEKRAKRERGAEDESCQVRENQCNGVSDQEEAGAPEEKADCPSSHLRTVVPGEKYNVTLGDALHVLFVDLDNPHNPLYRAMEAQEASMKPPFPVWEPMLPISSRFASRGSCTEKRQSAERTEDLTKEGAQATEENEDAETETEEKTFMELTKRRPQRQLTYEMSLPVTTLNRLLGLPSRAELEERYTAFVLSDASVVIQKDAFVRGLPLSDCFFTRVRYRLTALNAAACASFSFERLREKLRRDGEEDQLEAEEEENEGKRGEECDGDTNEDQGGTEMPETQLDFEYEVVFVKSTFLQGKISSQGEAQVVEALAQFLQYSREALQAAVATDEERPDTGNAVDGKTPPVKSRNLRT
ncbi:hypothetical protein TGFOU_365060 [Toxoplasma gondii FOU]|uniref:GRAM domain-containing protein n=1 Tax=Toxoplasma gondii FOU TaxID=943167 RepID=A0A086LH52_TOXGO|nr:hypothetical protein TGFOU_365060 [Toxoplasma gondii FOU]